MNVENYLEAVQNELKHLNVSPENLIKAVVELAMLAKSKGFLEEAKEVLSDCGIEFECEEVCHGKE